MSDNITPMPGGQRNPNPDQIPVLPPIAPGMQRFKCQIVFTDKQTMGVVMDLPNYALALANLAVFISQQPNKSGLVALAMERETSPIIRLR